MKVLTETGLGHLVERIRDLIPGVATEVEPGLLPQLSGDEGDVLLGTGEWGECRDATARESAEAASSAAKDVGAKLTGHISDQEGRDSEQDAAIEAAEKAGADAKSELDAYKETQGTRDTEQDAKIREAKEAADAAAEAIPPVVTKDGPGVVPPLPADASDKKLYAIGADEDGQATWYEVKASSGGAADPRELRALIASATKMHDEAWSGSQSDPLLHSWKNTPEAIAALQVAVDAAKVVSDGFGTDYFLQSELDDARDALQAAIETFKSTGEEVMPDLEEFESLKARVKAVDDSTVESADGKDVPFGSKYVLTSERSAAKGAVDTCQSSIDSATKQSQIDAACDTLETATAAYEGQVKTAPADTSALDSAIEAARKTREGVVVSEDGSELEPGSRYVTDQATLDAIDAAIQAATTAKTESTTQAQLDAATSAMEAATGEFDSKVQQNLKIPQSSEELEAMSWEEIAQLSAAAAKDPADFLFMVDSSHKLEKNVRMTGISGVTDVKARIIGVAHDVDENGETLGLTFELCDGLAYDQPVAMKMNSSNTTSGGWQNSLMRSTNLPKIEAALPADLRAVMKTMVKKTNMATSGQTMTETQDKLALLSCVEVFGPEKSNYGGSQSGFQSWYPLEGEWYEWYENHNTNADRVINQASGSALYWWLRSIQSSTTFAYVGHDGTFNWYYANDSGLPCACFSV